MQISNVMNHDRLLHRRPLYRFWILLFCVTLGRLLSISESWFHHRTGMSQEVSQALRLEAC